MTISTEDLRKRPVRHASETEVEARERRIQLQIAAADEIDRLRAELLAARAKLEAAEKLADVVAPFAEAAEECDECGWDDHNQAPVDAGQCREARTALSAWEAAQ